MSTYEKYYMENLYPLQDGVMSIIGKLNTPFFLTGGTALSRHYFRHRFSDDLDLFVNDCSEYQEHVEAALNALLGAEKKLSFLVVRDKIKRYQTFSQLFVRSKTEPECELKIDLVNDVAPRYGDLEGNPFLGKIDSWENILSNKLAALFRFEEKDITDIWVISKNKQFNWSRIAAHAKSKDAGVAPEVAHNIVNSFPIEKLASIRWQKKPDYGQFKKDLAAIADDLFYGRDNSLAS